LKTTKYLIAATLLLPFGAVTALPTFSAPAAKSAAKRKVITRGEINAMLVAVDKAANRRDVAGVCAPLAPNVVIKLTIQGQGSYTWNRAQYKSYMEQSFRAAQKYQYKRSNTKISIAPDGQSARLTATIHETVQVNSMTVRGITNETSTLRVQGGRTVITAINGVARIVQ
jgi:hypothetical protein